LTEDLTGCRESSGWSPEERGRTMETRKPATLDNSLDALDRVRYNVVCNGNIDDTYEGELWPFKLWR
jgi:hypothetical protein